MGSELTGGGGVLFLLSMDRPPYTLFPYPKYRQNIVRWGVILCFHTHPTQVVVLYFDFLPRSSEVGVSAEGGRGSLVCGVGVWPAPCVGGPGSVRRELLAYGMAHDTDAGECQRRGVNGECLGCAKALVVGPSMAYDMGFEVRHHTPPDTWAEWGPNYSRATGVRLEWRVDGRNDPQPTIP